MRGSFLSGLGPVYLFKLFDIIFLLLFADYVLPMCFKVLLTVNSWTCCSLRVFH